MKDPFRSYLEHLVGSLLPLLGHGVRRGLGGKTDGTEETDGDTHASHDHPEDTGTGAGGVDSAGAVGTESDPVSYKMIMSAQLTLINNVIAAAALGRLITVVIVVYVAHKLCRC